MEPKKTIGGVYLMKQNGSLEAFEAAIANCQEIGQRIEEKYDQ